MTNNQLSHVLRNIDLSNGYIVRMVNNLEAVLIEHHKSVTTNSGRRYIEYYDYLILLKDRKKTGIIMKCQFMDVHVYMYPQYRNQHILSRLSGGGFLKKIWSDIESAKCENRNEYAKIKYLVENAGFYLRN